MGRRPWQTTEVDFFGWSAEREKGKGEFAIPGSKLQVRRTPTPTPTITMRTQALRLVPRLPVQRPLTPSLIRMSSRSTSTMEPQFSAGEDLPTVQRGVESLITNGWGYDDEKMGIKKRYYFKGYFKAVVSFPY